MRRGTNSSVTRARRHASASASVARLGAYVLALFAALCISGCERARTQIIVRVEADAETWARVRSVHVFAQRESVGSTPIVSRCFDADVAPAISRVREVGLTPSDPDNATPVTVVVGMYGRPRQHRRRLTARPDETSVGRSEARGDTAGVDGQPRWMPYPHPRTTLAITRREPRSSCSTRLGHQHRRPRRLLALVSSASRSRATARQAISEVGRTAAPVA